MLRRIFISLAAALLAWGLWVPAGAALPKHPQGRVSDFAKVLSGTTAAEVTALAESLEKATGAQLAVVTVPSLENIGVDEYANKLFKQWGIGQKGKDNGVLLLVAPAEHKVKIEVGYGLEGVINDGKAGRILREAVVPYFQAGDYNQGILGGSERIAAAITGDESRLAVLPPAPKNGEAPLDPALKVMMFLFFGLFVTLGFLGLGAGFRGQGFFIAWGAGFGGIPLAMSIVFGLAFGFPIAILPVWALLMLVVGILTGKKMHKFLKPSGHGGSGGWSAGASFSSASGFGGGSSFSGFGGGSSGGGGASSSW